MARPIKDTPTLKGKDAKRFLKQLKKADQNKVSSAELAKMRKNFNALNSIAKF